VLIVILFLFAFTLFVGCAVKPIENTHTIEHIIEQKTDSVKTTQISKAILDSLIVKVAKVKTSKPECDSITQATLDQVLKQLNSYKKSGDNEAGIRYNEKLQQLVLWLKQGETKNQNLSTNKSIKDKEKEVKPPVIVKVKFIPFWIKILAWIGGLTVAFLGWRFARIFI
jgi:hypothetical protein